MHARVYVCACIVHRASCIVLPRCDGTQNLLGLVPLALLLGEVTEDLAIRLGETIGGLLNATFGA